MLFHGAHKNLEYQLAAFVWQLYNVDAGKESPNTCLTVLYLTLVVGIWGQVQSFPSLFKKHPTK